MYVGKYVSDVCCLFPVLGAFVTLLRGVPYYSKSPEAPVMSRLVEWSFNKVFRGKLVTLSLAST